MHLNPRATIKELFSICLLSTLAFVQWSQPVQASTLDADEWIVTADKMTRYENPPSVVAEGNVILEKKETSVKAAKKPASPWAGLLGADADDKGAAPTQASEETVTTIRADWVAYDVTLGQAKARGNLLISVNGDQLTAESGIIDLRKSTGSFDKAVIVRQDQDLHLEGDVIEKTGDVTYHIENGWVITCKLKDGETPPWSFGSSDTTITDGGYALLKNAVFRVKGIPIFYSPYMILPAKHERQTGFLFPAWSISNRDGFGLEAPFFVNISPSTDITLFPRYLSQRGLMLGGEFRYVTDEESKGMLMGHFLDDSLSDPSETGYYQDGNFTHTNQERYWVRGKADQNFGDWVARMDLDMVSDKDYLREFNSGSTSFDLNNQNFLSTFGRGFEQKLDQYRENTVEVLRSWDNGTSLQGEFLAINDVSDTNYTADDASKLWKLPSLTYSGLLPISDFGADFSWDANYVNYWREYGVRGQRFDIFPELTTNVPISPYLETTVRGGVRDTAYAIDDNDASDWKDTSSANRFLYTFGGEIGTTLAREYYTSGDGSGWRHTFRPFVEYDYTEIPDSDVLPQFDSVDRLEEANTIYYGINNFFTLFGNGKFDQDYAFLKVRHGYDMRSEVSDTPWTPVEIKTGFYPFRATRLLYSTDIDVYGDGFVEHTVEADYRSSRGDIFSLDYRYNEEYSIDSISGGVWYLLPLNFAAGYSIERAIESSTTIEEKFRLLYQPSCWSVEFSSIYTPDDQTFMVTFRLANIGMPFGFDLGGAGL